MASGKKKKGGKGRKQKESGLSGTTAVIKNPIVQTVTKGGLVVLAAIAAGGAGAALGKHSLIAGIPVTLYGFHKNNPYIIAAGLGLTLSNGFQNQNKSSAGEAVNGFDLKQMTADAKDRVGTFFKNFSEKLYINKGKSATAGLAGDGKDEQVTYFINPYSKKELDMTAMDRIQEQIATMSGGMSTVGEVDREF